MSARLFEQQQLLIRLAGNQPSAILSRFEKILYRPRLVRLVSFQVLNNTLHSGLHTVNSDFFTSIGFTPMGGMVRRYKTRKGKAARLLCKVINIPPACLITGKSNTGVRQMNAITCATAQSATSSVTPKQARKHAKRRARLELDSTWLPRVNQRARALSKQAFKAYRKQIIADLPHEPENWEYTEPARADAAIDPIQARYCYPRSLLNQERFITPATGQAKLSPSALVDDEFISPLLALLNQLRNDGHDITAPLDEALALRAGLKKAVQTLEDIHSQALKTCYQNCEVSGGAK